MIKKYISIDKMEANESNSLSYDYDIKEEFNTEETDILPIIDKDALNSTIDHLTTDELYALNGPIDNINDSNHTNLLPIQDNDLAFLENVGSSSRSRLFNFNNKDANLLDNDQGIEEKINKFCVDKLLFETRPYFLDFEQEDDTATEQDGISQNISKTMVASIGNKNNTITVEDDECAIVQEDTSSNILNERKDGSSSDGLIHDKSVKPPIDNVVPLSQSRSWAKKNHCPFCLTEVMHFPRHLKRKHGEEAEVKEMEAMPLKDPNRIKIINALRRQGNFSFTSQTNLIRPVRRPTIHYDIITDNGLLENTQKGKDQYVACVDCKGFFKRAFLRRHRKKCEFRSHTDIIERESHLKDTQVFTICSGANSEFYDKLRLKKEVFKIMRPDERSKVSMSDILICSYGEYVLQNEKKVQPRYIISKKIRELGRLLILLRETTMEQRLVDLLKPKFFNNLISAAKSMCGLDLKAKDYRTKLAIDMGIKLKRACNIAIGLITEKSTFLPVDDPDKCLKDLKELINLIEVHWNATLTGQASKKKPKNKQQENLKLIKFTNDITLFQTYLLHTANIASENISQKKQTEEIYNNLSNSIFALTSLHNSKYMDEIQYLLLTSYLSFNEQDEFYETNPIKCGNILIPIYIQDFIDVMLSVRDQYVSVLNEYLFAHALSKHECVNGIELMQKLALQSHIANPNIFTSKWLSKEISTVLHLITDSKKIEDSDDDFCDSEIEPNEKDMKQYGYLISDVRPNKATEKKTKISRSKWSTLQKQAITDFFKNHIKNNKAPKKREVEDFAKKHETLFKDRNWMTIKAFVYNSYRNK